MLPTVTDPPDWHDDAAMFHWLDAELEVRPPEPPFAEWPEIAKEIARTGNPEPLRKLYPEIAEFIFSPPWLKGKHRSRPTRLRRTDLIALAARDAARIRKLWREHYGKIKRSTDAVFFAVQLWDIPEEDLLAVRLWKPSGKRRAS